MGRPPMWRGGIGRHWNGGEVDWFSFGRKA
jgi:hypothetical protein